MLCHNSYPPLPSHQTEGGKKQSNPLNYPRQALSSPSFSFNFNPPPMKKTTMIDPGMTLPPDNRIHLFDPVGLINENYGGYNIVKQRRAAQSYDSLPISTNGGGLRFDTYMMDDESSATSPRLWKSSPPTPLSPKAMAASSPPHPLQSTSPKAAPAVSSLSHHSQSTPNHLQSLSPNSRTQAIARGRKELMDMIKDMPESFYELSLKDIVEQKPATEDHVRNDQGNKGAKEIRFVNDDKVEKPQEKKTNKKGGKKMKSSESRAKMVRSASIDNGGFLLKTSVFPISLGSKKNRKSLAASASFKVAPKPTPTTAPNGSAMKGTERDWWKKKSCISSESEAVGSSGNSISAGSSRSNSSNSRHRHSSRFLPSCCSFLNGKRTKSKK